MGIFRINKEHYIRKVMGNVEIAKHVLQTAAQKPKKTNVSEILNELAVDGSKNSTIMECNQCGRRFDDKESLKTHQDILHSGDLKSLRKTYSCKYCSKQFSFQVNVRRHMYLVHPHGNDMIDNEDDQEEGNDENDDLSADYIPENHSETVSTEENDHFPKLDQFKCKICGIFLKSKRYLVAHIQSHYGGGYKCDYPGCTSVFKENAKLKRHKLVHTGEKAFKCEYCGLSFSLRHNLKTHEKTHTRTDLLKCKYCSYETIQKSNLRQHETIHERSGGQSGGRGRSRGRPVGQSSSRKTANTLKDDHMDATDSNIDQFIEEIE